MKASVNRAQTWHASHPRKRISEKHAGKIRDQEGASFTSRAVDVGQHPTCKSSGSLRPVRRKRVVISLIFGQLFRTQHFIPLTDGVESELRKAKSRASVQYAIAIVITAMSLACVAAKARDAGPQKGWSAPASEAAKINPIAASQDSIKAGEKIYANRCLSCHGTSGNGDGPDAADLGIYPAKFSDPRLRGESDGAFYWKITVGKKPMPGYKTRLSEKDRWNVINYLRTLAK